HGQKSSCDRLLQGQHDERQHVLHEFLAADPVTDASDVSRDNRHRRQPRVRHRLEQVGTIHERPPIDDDIPRFVPDGRREKITLAVVANLEVEQHAGHAAPEPLRETGGRADWQVCQPHYPPPPTTARTPLPTGRPSWISQLAPVSSSTSSTGGCCRPRSTGATSTGASVTGSGARKVRSSTRATRTCLRVSSNRTPFATWTVLDGSNPSMTMFSQTSAPT